jgi:hypothetical protein
LLKGPRAGEVRIDDDASVRWIFSFSGDVIQATEITTPKVAVDASPFDKTFRIPSLPVFLARFQTFRCRSEWSLMTKNGRPNVLSRLLPHSLGLCQFCQDPTLSPGTVRTW